MLSLVFRPDLSWEFLSEDEIISRSVKAVSNHIRHIKETSPFYKEFLKDVDPSDINTPEDISRLPITEKAMLVDNIEKFRAVKQEQVVETVVTSGSTGKPLTFVMTEGDLDRLAFNEALSFLSTGVTSKDSAQILVSLDRLFIAGMAYYRGLTTLGVNTSRIGVLPFEMQRYYFNLLKPTILVGVPSYLKKFALGLSDAGVDTQSSQVKKIICIGESLRNENLEPNSIARSLQDIFNASVYSTYGVTELSVSYCECVEQNGGHSHPELVYTEIVDDKGNPVPEGTPGELVATTLGVEGIPLLRYRTKDITFKVKGKCACGRNSVRIGPILARKSQMIKIKGTTVYPLTITNALDELDYIEDYVIILEGDESLSDRVSIHLAAQPAVLEKITAHLSARARVNIPLLISNSATINSIRGDSRKKIRIVDKRV